MRYSTPILLLFFVGLFAQAQVKNERAFRIRKEQFPAEALKSVTPYLNDVRKLRFYKEIDSNRYRHRISFKKDRLFYHIDFDQQGKLGTIGVLISPVDIPNQSWQTITDHLQGAFEKYKVRSISQQYPREAFPSDSVTFRNAFQNLILPELRYGLLVRGKSEEGKRDFEILYDHLGELLRMRESLPPNYDHVLY